jgi:hypothetical protein
MLFRKADPISCLRLYAGAQCAREWRRRTIKQINEFRYAQPTRCADKYAAAMLQGGEAAPAPGLEAIPTQLPCR